MKMKRSLGATKVVGNKKNPHTTKADEITKSNINSNLRKEQVFFSSSVLRDFSLQTKQTLQTLMLAVLKGFCNFATVKVTETFNS